jgi:hypothetical protein
LQLNIKCKEEEDDNDALKRVVVICYFVAVQLREDELDTFD